MLTGLEIIFLRIRILTRSKATILTRCDGQLPGTRHLPKADRLQEGTMAESRTCYVFQNWHEKGYDVIL